MDNGFNSFPQQKYLSGHDHNDENKFMKQPHCHHHAIIYITQ